VTASTKKRFPANRRETARAPAASHRAWDRQLRDVMANTKMRFAGPEENHSPARVV
jgi:hypothetical protein